MHPNKQDSVYGMYLESLVHKINQNYFNMDDFDKALMARRMEIARAEMGGDEGIHKPTSGNPDRLRR
jgi:hypothetical protein